jgi:hypothetical protein
MTAGEIYALDQVVVLKPMPHVGAFRFVMRSPAWIIGPCTLRERWELNAKLSFQLRSRALSNGL